MAEEDIYGQAIIPEEDDLPPEEAATDPPETDQAPEETTEDATANAEALQTDGQEPTTVEEARKYWQAAYTRSRQKDRERYGTLEKQHTDMAETLRRFYADDQYARQVLAQRFPQLAALTQQQTAAAGSGTPTPPARQTTGQLTTQLQQSLGEFGFLAQALGPVLEQVIAEQVQARVGPLEQRTTQQTEQARQAEEDKLLAAMDGKYPGWEDQYGTKMQDLDAFLASDRLEHPVFGNKYELLYRLLNPDAGRVEAARQMGQAARRRTSLSRTGHQAVSNVTDLVRKADSNADAFAIAMRAAMGGGERT